MGQISSILIISSSEQTQRLWSDLLRPMGFAVFPAHNAVAARSTLEQLSDKCLVFIESERLRGKLSDLLLGLLSLPFAVSRHPTVVLTASDHDKRDAERMPLVVHAFGPTVELNEILDSIAEVCGVSVGPSHESRRAG